MVIFGLIFGAMVQSVTRLFVTCNNFDGGEGEHLGHSLCPVN
jgi:hypothetical protein